MGNPISYRKRRLVSEFGLNDDRGSVTLWVLGLTVIVLGFGGIALDFWRALATQREIAAIADAASVAAAGGIDEEHYRETGFIRLDSNRARSLGMASVELQGTELASVAIVVADDGSDVQVQIVDEVAVGLLGFFIGDDEPLVVRAFSTAQPVLIP